VDYYLACARVLDYRIEGMEGGGEGGSPSMDAVPTKSAVASMHMSTMEAWCGL
jgi:hypothetical protein